MEVRTVSEHFNSLLSNGNEVEAAIFTTYNFEPEFFEQEIIPLMLGQNIVFSSDSRIKNIQVREVLSEVGLPIDVFYDRDMFRHQGTISPSMEYRHHGVRGDISAFHAKLVFLLVYDKNAKKRSLWIGAGSANLTGAGWWENVECQHWEQVTSGKVSRRFLNRLREDMDWLARHQVSRDEESALSQISQFLEQCQGSNSAPVVSYYGLSQINVGQRGKPAFIRFIQQAIKDSAPHYKSWNLEIISPYFADKSDFDAHGYFKEMGVENIKLFLPKNDQDEALVKQEYFERIAHEEGIEWAAWHPEIARKLILQTNSSSKRFTHAKIFHFYNGMQSWVFVGSVNFTHRAISDNQEAGFFTQLPRLTSLLQPLNASPDKWCNPDDLPSAQLDNVDEARIPQIHLVYDWKQRVFEAGIADKKACAIEILSSSGNSSLPLTALKGEGELRTIYIEPAVIESLLHDSGFMRVRGYWIEDNKDFSEHLVLVQQCNWTHKPLDLPLLSPQEIMQIYAGLNQLRRNQVIEHLKERQLRDTGLLSESISITEYEQQGRQFFSEYAELFHAFRNLRRRLMKACKEENYKQLDYYLTGKGMDSLPTLMDSLYEKDRPFDAVTLYLTLLCLIQLYSHDEFLQRPQVQAWLSICESRCDDLERSGQLKLVSDDPDRTKSFFDWYRQQFYQEYREVVIEEDMDAVH